MVTKKKKTTHTHHTHKRSANSHSSGQSPAPQSDETAKPATEHWWRSLNTTLYNTEDSLAASQMRLWI